MSSKRKRVRGKQRAPLKNKMKRGPRAVFWVFTDNGAEGTKGRELVPEAWKVLPDGVRFIAWQYERSESKQQLHLQGYIELMRGQYLSWLHANVSSTACYFVRKGTQEEALAYVQKEKSRLEGPWELGSKTEGQGMRTDLESFRDAIDKGTPLRILRGTHLQQLAKYPRLYQLLLPLARPRRRQGCGIQVTLLIGKPGTGKTRSVYDRWEDSDQFYRIPSCRSGGLWMNGYDFHEKVLLDEFAGASSHMRLDRLLEITDRYPLRLETKGGFTWFHPTHLAITTTKHPKYWYTWDTRSDEYLALKRRIQTVLLFTDANEKPIEAGEDFWWDPILDPPPINKFVGNPVDDDGQWGPFAIHKLKKQSTISALDMLLS